MTRLSSIHWAEVSRPGVSSGAESHTSSVVRSFCERSERPFFLPYGEASLAARLLLTRIGPVGELQLSSASADDGVSFAERRRLNMAA